MPFKILVRNPWHKIGFERKYQFAKGMKSKEENLTTTILFTFLKSKLLYVATLIIALRLLL